MSAGTLLGYLDRWSVFPGDTVTCRVSCTGDNAYNAELVRVIQGDTHPDAPGYSEQRVPLDPGGPFPPRTQPIEPGSMAIVDDSPRLTTPGSFSIAAAIWPTTPSRGAQTLFSRHNPDTGQSLEFFINDSGALAAELSTGNVSVHVANDCCLRARCWYFIAMSYDAVEGCVSVSQKPLTVQARTIDSDSRSTEAPRNAPLFNIGAPLTMAARLRPVHGDRRHYNGRIHNPRILGGAIDAPTPNPVANAGPFLAAWDFSLETPSQRIVDISGNQMHGRLVNLPTRGVTGPDWDGSSHAWPHDAGHFAAIHFHDDDLYDAGWEESFSFTLPENLASAVYAVRLHNEADEFYMPFCVRAPRSGRKNDVVFLMPTASYMAYANNRIGLDVPETELVCGRLIELTEQDLFMQTHPELGLCFYDLHNDGSGVYYSSRLRPVMDLQPKFVGKLGGDGSNVWQFNADTHILGWLDSQGIGFDVVTDEDLHEEGAACLDGYRVVITGSHPEYYSASMLDGLDGFCGSGGRLMYLGGNGFYWRISFHPSLPGVIECRKSEDGIRAFAPGPGEYYSSFTGEYTGLWRRNGRPPNTLTGVGMVAQGFDQSSPYFRTEASRDPRVAFMFEGIHDEVIGEFGLSGGGAAGIEIDAANTDLGTPPNALVVASSRQHSDLYLMTPEDMLDPVPGLGGTEAEIIRADIVFFETPRGGAVFSVGSVAWPGSMAWNGYDNPASRLTANVLRRFVDPQTF